MKKGSFLEMLNKVSSNRSFYHENQHGLCSWVFKSMPPKTHNITLGTGVQHIAPDTNNMYEILSHFSPNEDDITQLEYSGKNTGYWASESASDKCGELTPLRETILLFCAAINNEL